MERNGYLVEKKFYKYLIPSFFAEMSMHTGTVIDGVIVGNLLGIDALAAVALGKPIVFLLQIPGLILGLGGATLAAILLGERKREQASNMFSACIFSTLIFSVAIGLSAFFVTDPLGKILSAGTALDKQVAEYLFIQILGLPTLSIALVTCEFLAVDNHPGLAAWMFTIAEIVHVALDFLLIGYFGWGLTGAAAAAVIGNGVGLLVLVPYARSKARMLSIYYSALHHLGTMWEAVKVGTPRISMEVVQFLQFFCLNTSIVYWLGDEAMGVYAVCTNTLFMAELLAGGIVSVIPNLCGVLYGDRDYFGMKKVVKGTITLSSVLIIILTAVFFIMPERIALMFGLDDMSLMPVAKVCLEIYALSFLPYIINEFLQVYYQTILQAGIATLNTILEGFVLLIPMSLLMMHFYGIYGVCAAVTISEILTIIIVEAYRKYGQDKGKFPKKGVLMIPDDTPDTFDCTIRGNVDESVKISQQIIDWCKERKIPDRIGNILGLAAEEISVNISRYGYKDTKRNFIDISLFEDDGKYILRIRDDGIHFDPTSYEPEEEEKYSIGGIQVIRKLATKLDYMRVLDMNNTIIEVDAEKN